MTNYSSPLGSFDHASLPSRVAVSCKSARIPAPTGCLANAQHPMYTLPLCWLVCAKEKKDQS